MQGLCIRNLGALAAVFAAFAFAPAQAQTIAYAPQAYEPLATDENVAEPARPELRRQMVDYRTNEPAGTIVVDTPHTFLYYVLGNGKAIRYGIGVGREGFTWAGSHPIVRKAEWPDWYPPAEMVARQPYLPRMTAGGPGNPLGARALYIGGTQYRIHGTNNPATIGHEVSSGCIRLTNEDITDLYSRVQIGSKVVVLPQTAHATPKQETSYVAPAPGPAERTWANMGVSIRPATSGLY